MTRRLLAALTVALACVLVTAPAQARPSLPTLTVDTSQAGPLPARTAANSWAKSGAVAFKFGTCAGPGCVQVRHVDQQQAGTCYASTAGCSYHLADGTCVVSVTAFYDSFKWVPQMVTTHELGHCLGVPHRDDDPGSVMHSAQSPYDSIRTPDAADLQYLRDVTTGRVALFDPGTCGTCT